MVGLYGVAMLVAAVLSLKGGVGKTTVTLGLVSAAVHAGLNTLLVDLDPQMNATTTVEIDESGPSVADVLDQSPPVGGERCAPEIAVERPASGAARQRGRRGAQQPRSDSQAARPADHRHRQGRSEPRIWCSSTARRRSASSPAARLVASDRAVLVTEPSLYAVTGVQRALEAVQKERLTHRHLQPLGVVVNRVRPRITEHDYRLAELRDLFGPLVLNPPLPDRAAIQQAQGAAVPIHSWPTAGAREIAAMFDALLDRLMRSAKQKSRV